MRMDRKVLDTEFKSRTAAASTRSRDCVSVKLMFSKSGTYDPRFTSVPIAKRVCLATGKASSPSSLVHPGIDENPDTHRSALFLVTWHKPPTISAKTPVTVLLTAAYC